MQAAGAVVPAFEVLDAVHKGILDVGNGWPGYWYGKHPAATLFGSVPGGPFGMNARGLPGLDVPGAAVHATVQRAAPE